jgi:transposase
VSEYDGHQYVGIDLHRHRSVIVRQDAEGNQLSLSRISNDPVALAEQISKAGAHPDVVLEATNGWYWAADVLTAAGARVHLAHPLGIKGMNTRRVKTDARDATDLADLLRMHRLPEAWIAPPALRQLRELVRHRSKLVNQRSGLKAGVHAVLAKQGLASPVSDLFGVAGRAWLASAPLDSAYRARVNSLCRLIECSDFEIDLATHLITTQVARDPDYGPGYRVIQQLPGIGPVLAAVFCVEIGDVHRFSGARQVCSWAGLTPRHRESDLVVHRGRITKQGSRLVRWAAVEAAQKVPASCVWLSGARAGITVRRGRNIATVAVARKLLTLVYYGLRDGQIRALRPAGPDAG